MVLEQSFNYTNRTDASDEYYGSLDRFSAIYFETDNFLHDFWLGTDETQNIVTFTQMSLPIMC